jgi:UPF0755 protein
MSITERVFLWIFTIISGFLVAFTVLITPPIHFPSGEIISIPQGETLDELATELKQNHLVNFASVFKAVMILSGKQTAIQSGDYIFAKPLSVFALAERIVNGQYDIPLVRVTIPEGSTNAQIASIISGSNIGNNTQVGVQPKTQAKIQTEKMLLFSADDFLSKAAAKQGYLFPDTYFFPEDESANAVIGVMEDNFNKKIALIQPEIFSFSTLSTATNFSNKLSENIGSVALKGATQAQTFADVIVMASILEKEAANTADRRIIAGILWKRLALGIPLEVDSATTTYSHLGLPLSPVCNPGLDSIIDAINPTMTPYLYYLSDSSGTMHYAATFAEHEINIAKYLK